jgi:hypothetical protein
MTAINLILLSLANRLSGDHRRPEALWVEEWGVGE